MIGAPEVNGSSTLVENPATVPRGVLKRKIITIKRHVQHAPQGNHKIDIVNTENPIIYKTTIVEPHDETLALFDKSEYNETLESSTIVKNVPKSDLRDEFEDKSLVDETEAQRDIVDNATIRPALASGLQDDFRHAVAALLTPSAQPVIVALVMDYGALVKAARDILAHKARLKWKSGQDSEQERSLKSGADDDPHLSPPQIKAVMANSTLGRMQRRYEIMLRDIDLPATGFTTKDQALEAGRLVSTYNNLRKRQIELGLEVSPRDPQVTEAHRLRVAFQRQEKRQAAPVPPQRGRPPKLETSG